MLPGPDQIVACPSCHGLAKYMTLASGNTLGATVWTDGKQIAPMLPLPPAIVECHHCKEFYWLCDAEQVGKLGLWGGDEESVAPAWRDAVYVKEPTEADYYSAIGRNLARDREQERSLRIFAWWRRNDAFREGSGVPNTAGSLASVEFRENLEVLSELLDVANENDLVMKAEVLREMGEFEASIAILKTIETGEYAPVVLQLLDLCEGGDTVVRELRFDD